MSALYGYCALTADFLHIGHIRYLQNCKEHCKMLTVGVMSDECVEQYKGKKPLMKYAQRVELVKSIKIVNNVVIQNTFEFDHAILRMKEFWGDEMIIFDNAKHNRKGADKLFPYMEGISSSKFKEHYLL